MIFFIISFMKIPKNMGPIKYPWGTPTVAQLKFNMFPDDQKETLTLAKLASQFIWESN